MESIPVTVQSKAQVCSRWTDGIASMNAAGSVDVRLLCLLCVVWVAASATG
jgi:hypothetical protein